MLRRAMPAAGMLRCRTVAVLGVDFMSENVRAILDDAGHTGVQVRAPLQQGRDCRQKEEQKEKAF